MTPMATPAAGIGPSTYINRHAPALYARKVSCLVRRGVVAEKSLHQTLPRLAALAQIPGAASSPLHRPYDIRRPPRPSMSPSQLFLSSSARLAHRRARFRAPAAHIRLVAFPAAFRLSRPFLPSASHTTLPVAVVSGADRRVALETPAR